MPRYKFTQGPLRFFSGRLPGKAYRGIVFTNGVSNDISLKKVDVLAANHGGEIVDAQGNRIGDAGLTYRRLQERDGPQRDPNAWKSAFLMGANIYTQSQWQGLVDKGFTPRVLNMFNENAAGVEGWVKNVAKSAQNLANYVWARARGLKFDIITLTASPQEPMSQFTAGQWDNEYREIIQNSVALAGPDADALFFGHNHEMDLKIQSDGHYAHTANQPGGNEDFKANWLRARSINQAIDNRIKMGLIRIGNTSTYDANWNWRDAMPDPESVDWYGADPYFIPRYDGADGARVAWNKLQGPMGLEAWLQYANGKPFALREYGASSNDTAYNEVIFDRLYAYPNVMYVNWWDQNNMPSVNGVKPKKVGFDTTFESWEAQLEWIARESSPPVLLIPNEVRVAAGTPTRVRLRCTKNRIAWSIVDNTRPDAIVKSGNSLMVTLTSGSATVTVRATDAHKQSTDLTIAISVASTNLYPLLGAGLDFMVGTDGEPARGENDDFIFGLAA